jgi:hypothetical protein
VKIQPQWVVTPGKQTENKSDSDFCLINYLGNLYKSCGTGFASLGFEVRRGEKREIIFF